MLKGSPKDTIAAIATPVGEGGIAVLRISGPDAQIIANRGFRGTSDLSAVVTRTAHVGQFVAPDGETVDQVIAVVFKEPGSYTGENVVEISCHGGRQVPGRILQALLEYGARLAEPGEFTRRAFLNGKMDLSQAEAVADLIRSDSDRSRRSSFLQLKGNLGAQVHALRERLIHTTGLLELELDFAEEGLEFADKTRVSGQIGEALKSIKGLRESYSTGRLYRDGVKVVLAGMPNVGKSSILNSLLREQRAIVTEIPGTTRDTIEESLMIDGLAFRVVDTAGLREAVDRIEQEGIRRSEDQIKSCDLMILVLDSGRSIGDEEKRLAERLVRDLDGKASTIVALNKIDLAAASNGRFNEALAVLSPKATVRISALTGEGIEGLRKAMLACALSGGHTGNEASVTVTNARHYDVLVRAEQSLTHALRSVEDGVSGEFVTPDLRAALDTLGEITGAVTTDDILNEIFSKFCIGK